MTHQAVETESTPVSREEDRPGVRRSVRYRGYVGGTSSALRERFCGPQTERSNKKWGTEDGREMRFEGGHEGYIGHCVCGVGWSKGLSARGNVWTRVMGKTAEAVLELSRSPDRGHRAKRP